jgi:NitT/TauT family transport system permease protein
VYPYIVAFNSVPRIAISPLIVIWFGTGLQSKAIIAALVSFFPLLISVIVGLKAVDVEQLQLMRSLKARKWQTFRTVIFPNALPSIFGGLEIAIVLAVVGAIVGEFMGASQGLGYYILFANSRFDTAGMFAAFFILGVLGMILNLSVKLVAKRVVFWRGIDVIAGG